MQRENTALASTADVKHQLQKSTAWSTLASKSVLKTLGLLRRGRLTITLPDGSSGAITGKETADGPHGIVDIHDMNVFKRLFRSGDIGLAEAYMANEFSTPDLTQVMHLAIVNETAFSEFIEGSFVARILRRFHHGRRSNTKIGSRKNIAHHYDLGNDFYQTWLDEGMTYSSALFADPKASLMDAQTAKYEALCNDLSIKPGDSVLEIGCGWGAFAEHAAKHHGAYVTAVTIAQEQFDFAQKRVQASGLNDQVTIKFQDYRDIKGQFDRIASVEMFEAVGESHWPTFFQTIKDRLAPKGAAALQVITIEEDRFQSYRSNPDFIQRYVFPGGMLPSTQRFHNAAASVGLSSRVTRSFGPDYAETLRHWQDTFDRAWDNIQELGFDERFRRMWAYYFSYCEVGFETGRIDVEHFLLNRS